jgi:hypothetical protein
LGGHGCCTAGQSGVPGGHGCCTAGQSGVPGGHGCCTAGQSAGPGDLTASGNSSLSYSGSNVPSPGKNSNKSRYLTVYFETTLYAETVKDNWTHASFQFLLHFKSLGC